MPPFGPRRLEVKLTDEEKALAAERKRLQNDTYARLRALVAGRRVVERLSPLTELEISAETEYRVRGQAKNKRTQARAETGLGVKDHPYLTIYTREVAIHDDGERDKPSDWAAQLTLRPERDTGVAVMYDYYAPYRTWNDREAVEILTAGADTVTKLEREPAPALAA